ncbi:RNA polymerase sigma factor [Sorangium cellulosum]|jgi:RNA polymerase sigma factor for flagellar operon FliA|uniref:RNA polymerase sigma factor n=1 Tax=Sorangium cellulosum TaxID=56 RepID=A0A4P2PU33_SORCE|nr:sigma-70 family RNA polymerase sigma factor [Sorangium cellulosum]AUX20255.1 RNA polymerase sigma factor [Sorangium cellulosum]
MARHVARTTARVYGVRTRQGLEDCEQTAYQALLEACPGYDATRGVPFGVYAWKRVAGAVMRLLTRESSLRRAGLEAALDAAESMRDTSDLFGDDDADALSQLKDRCRAVVFARFVAETGEHLRAHPEDAVARTQAFEALGKALRGLDAQEARLIELRYWRDLSWAKVAAELGVHEKYAQRLDEQLRRRLRGELRASDIDRPPPSERT